MLNYIYYILKITVPIGALGLLINIIESKRSVLDDYLFKLEWLGLKLLTSCDEYYKLYKKSFITNDYITVICDGVEIIQITCKNSAIVDNKIVHKKLLQCLTNTTNSILSSPLEDFDMILYKIPSEDDKYYYSVKRIDNINVLDANYKFLEYPEKNVNILSPCVIGSQVEVEKLDGKIEIFPINLDTDNYFLEHNKLFDEKFIKYWLYEHYNLGDFNSYKVSYFDKNTMNLEILEEGDYMTITTDGCKITRKRNLLNSSEFLII